MIKKLPPLLQNMVTITFKVTPFGLTNAPATFQRETNPIFFDLINNCVQIYLDDIIIYSPNVEQHLLDLKEVFNILRKHKYYN